MLLFLLLLAVGNLKYVLLLVSTISLLQFTVVQSPSTWWSSGRLDVLNCVGSYLLAILASDLLLFSTFYPSLQLTVVQSPSAWYSTCAGAISLVGNFGAHPLKTRVKWAQIAKTLARLPLLHFCTKFSLKISDEDHQKHLHARDQTQVCLLCHLFTKPLPASLCTTFDRNNCRLIMM